MLAQSVADGSRRIQMHTYRAEVHDAGEGDEPEVLGEDHPATIELGVTLGAWVSERNIKQRAYQKPIG